MEALVFFDAITGSVFRDALKRLGSPSRDIAGPTEANHSILGQAPAVFRCNARARESALPRPETGPRGRLI